MQSPEMSVMNSKTVGRAADTASKVADDLVRKNLNISDNSGYSYWGCTMPSLSDNMFMIRNLLGVSTVQSLPPASNVRSQVSDVQLLHEPISSRSSTKSVPYDCKYLNQTY
jgi:hypothetical protein